MINLTLNLSNKICILSNIVLSIKLIKKSKLTLNLAFYLYKLRKRLPYKKNELF